MVAMLPTILWFQLLQCEYFLSFFQSYTIVNQLFLAHHFIDKWINWENNEDELIKKVIALVEQISEIIYRSKNNPKIRSKLWVIF